MRPGGAKDIRAQEFYDSYELEYGIPNPTHRDQAFSFDVALVLNEAFSDDLLDESYRKGLQRFAENIENVEVSGVTGLVRFRNPRADFKRFHQNDQSNVRIVQFDPTRRLGEQWIDVVWQAWEP